MTTEEHIAKSAWWPRKGEATRSDFVGAEVCAECHSTLVNGQRQHAMAQTSSPITSATSVPQTAHMDNGPAHYSINAEDGTLMYKVRYGTETFSARLEWLFGSGHHGQTYLYHRGSEWWETRMSVFNDGSGITPGESTAVPSSLADAIGRRVPDQELPQCFGCHSTAPVTAGQFDPASAMPGISCEGCHGPGAAHVALAHAGIGTDPGLIFNPARLDPPNKLDFCGACHRTWWDALQLPEKSVSILRLPAYRLEQSRCWGNGDARLTCIACHNPHKPLVKESSQYDDKCLRCHVSSPGMATSADHPGAGCPVKSSNCTSCHMPNYELPEVHSRFTDHRIRVVRDAGTIPE